MTERRNWKILNFRLWLNSFSNPHTIREELTNFHFPLDQLVSLTGPYHTKSVGSTQNSLTLSDHVFRMKTRFSDTERLKCVDRWDKPRSIFPVVKTCPSRKLLDLRLYIALGYFLYYLSITNRLWNCEISDKLSCVGKCLLRISLTNGKLLKLLSMITDLFER